MSDLIVAAGMFIDSRHASALEGQRAGLVSPSFFPSHPSCLTFQVEAPGQTDQQSPGKLHIYQRMANYYNKLLATFIRETKQYEVS